MDGDVRLMQKGAARVQKGRWIERKRSMESCEKMNEGQRCGVGVRVEDGNMWEAESNSDHGRDWSGSTSVWTRWMLGVWAGRDDDQGWLHVGF